MPSASAFLPSQHAFRFGNSWPSQPAVTVDTPFGDVDIGNAKGGLCGGMVFASVDYWHAGAEPATDRPAAGQPLYKFLVRRLIDSWHIPAGIAQYYQWMNLPDGDATFRVLGRKVIVERGLAWRTIRLQWPQIRADLDKGVPAALGIVTVDSANPKDLAFNHQVLAWGYQVEGRDVTVRVYDPNRGPRDDIAIRFSTGDATRPVVFDHDLGLSRPVRGFFRTAYAPAGPPRS